MAVNLATIDWPLRRAQRGIWEYSLEGTARYDFCQTCGAPEALNVLGICQACNFKDKMGSIGIIAEPVALRMVRREHGINGESNRADRERKVRRAEAEGEVY